MNNKLIACGMFVIGAAVGSIVTWKLTKTKYEQIAREEIESVKEVYSRMANETEPEPEAKSMVEEYRKTVEDSGYISLNKEEKKKEDTMTDAPYVISPEEFGEFDDYDIVSLTYYADGVLTDAMDDVMNDDDIELYIGANSLEHFGEYEEDSVFVRNNEFKIDYEILRDNRMFKDVV